VNGIHDMGGLHGFGRMDVEQDEPVFHARWEGRVFGMRILCMRRLATTIDSRRHALERLDPFAYLANGDYARWQAAFERLLAAKGLCPSGELEARVRELAARPAGHDHEHGHD
jgi:nitrile hydratase